jgi:hypothetical protein
MLTNPFETQMVKSLGVAVGGRTSPPAPFEHLRASMANSRPGAFVGEPDATGSGCPFAASLAGPTSPEASSAVAWAPEAEARLERIPAFIRPMARRSIERFAEEKGYASITETVMDEARTVFGM